MSEKPDIYAVVSTQGAKNHIFSKRRFSCPCRSDEQYASLTLSPMSPNVLNGFGLVFAKDETQTAPPSAALRSSQCLNCEERSSSDSLSLHSPRSEQRA